MMARRETSAPDVGSEAAEMYLVARVMIRYCYHARWLQSRFLSDHAITNAGNFAKIVFVGIRGRQRLRLRPWFWSPTASSAAG